MATNRKFAEADKLKLPVPADTVSGDPLVLGALPCVAVTDRDSDGESSVQANGAYELTANGIDDLGDAAIGVGDIAYLQADGTVDADNGGTRFGYFLEAVASGADAVTVAVKIGY